MNIKTSLLFVIAAICFISCRKSSNNNLSSTKIVLDAPKVSGKIITLNWSKLVSDSLESYTLVKVTDTINSQSTMSLVIDKNITTFTDTMPLAPYVQYYVVANVLTRSYYATPIISNKQTCTRTDISFIATSPTDAIYDRSTHMMYIYNSTGDINIYDVQNKKSVLKVNVNATIGYCDLGTYNGVRELYVPRSDGWLFIYDATTLKQIDQINVGSPLGCVVSNNGKLFMSGNSNSAALASYDRATKALVSQTYLWDNPRLKLIPNSNSEFFGIGSGTSQAYYYKFDNGGVYVSQLTQYLNNYYLSPGIFEVMPDGNSFISTSAGIIVNKSLAYVASLPHGNMNFTSFDFDNTNRLIYAGCQVQSIQAYSMDTYLLSKTIGTQGFPFKVFYDNGAIISLSLTSYQYSYNGYPVYTFVEQF